MVRKALPREGFDHGTGGLIYLENFTVDDSADKSKLKEEKSEAPAKPQVWFGSMPESNGKTNWTAILHKGDITDGFTIACSEYHDRVRYEADIVRYILGELDKKPYILDYDHKLHSGYVPKPEDR